MTLSTGNNWIDLIIGITTLVLAGKYLVDGSVLIAEKLNLSKLVIGSTIIALGTSFPELLLSVKAALGGHPDLALGNVLGSNMANIALVLGVTAMISPILVVKDSIKFGWPVMFCSSIFLYLLCLSGTIGRVEGVVAIVLLIAFIYYSISKDKKDSLIEQHNPISNSSKNSSIIAPSLIVLISLFALSKGADILIEAAQSIAIGLDISERVISITVIAIGSSLPELTASVIAALKKETALSIGNVIGSNIFNILAVLGTTAIVKPISIDIYKFEGDLIWVIGITLILFLMIYPVSRFYKSILSTDNSLKIFKFDPTGGVVRRWEGLILLALYIYYIYSLV